MLAARLLPFPVCTAETDPRVAVGELLPGEEHAVARAVESRRREFSAGRACARAAMAALGAQALPILQGEDRAPIWPAGFVGSITHTHAWCAAAVGRTSDGIRAVGIDVEPALPIDVALTRIICTATERSRLAASGAPQSGLWARLIFSAKEAAYKCQYQLSRQLLGFHDMEIEFDKPTESFLAIFRKAAGPFSAGQALKGRYLVLDGHLMTAVALGV